MSINASKWARNADVGKSTSKLVLMMLAQHVRYDSDDWLVYSSIEYLASVTHLNRKTVIDALARLREIGAIVDTGRKAGGNRSCPIYRLCPQNVPLISTAAEPRMASHDAQPGLMPQPELDLRPGTQDAVPAPAAEPAPAPAPAEAHDDVQAPSEAPPPPSDDFSHARTIQRSEAAGKPSKATVPGMAGSAPSPLSQDWELPSRWRLWTQRERPHWCEEKIDTVAAMFKSYYRSKTGPGALSGNWYESWRLWVFRERDARQEDPKAWSRSWTGIQQMGRQLGLEQLPNEPEPRFRMRVHEAAGVPLEAP